MCDFKIWLLFQGSSSAILESGLSNSYIRPYCNQAETTANVSIPKPANIWYRNPTGTQNLPIVPLSLLIKPNDSCRLSANRIALENGLIKLSVAKLASLRPTFSLQSKSRSADQFWLMHLSYFIHARSLAYSTRPDVNVCKFQIVNCDNWIDFPLVFCVIFPIEEQNLKRFYLRNRSEI